MMAESAGGGRNTRPPTASSTLSGTGSGGGSSTYTSAREALEVAGLVSVATVGGGGGGDGGAASAAGGGNTAAAASSVKLWDDSDPEAARAVAVLRTSLQDEADALLADIAWIHEEMERVADCDDFGSDDDDD